MPIVFWFKIQIYIWNFMPVNILLMCLPLGLFSHLYFLNYLEEKLPKGQLTLIVVERKGCRAEVVRKYLELCPSWLTCH